MKEPDQWHSAEAHAMIASYELYLNWYPKGDHADLARQRVQELERRTEEISKAVQRQGIRVSEEEEWLLKTCLKKHLNFLDANWNLGPKWDYDVRLTAKPLPTAVQRAESPKAQPHFKVSSPPESSPPVHVSLRDLAAFPPHHVMAVGTVSIVGNGIDRQFTNICYVRGRLFRLATIPD